MTDSTKQKLSFKIGIYNFNFEKTENTLLNLTIKTVEDSDKSASQIPFNDEKK